MPAVKMLPPNVAVFWVPDQNDDDCGRFPEGDGIKDIDCPTAAEINAGYNISCAMTTDFTLGWTDRDTDDTRGLCDDAAVENPTTKNFEGQLNFFMDKNQDETDSIYNTVRDLFDTPLQSGYLVQRIGKHPRRDPEVKDGDRVTIFKFYSGDPNIQNDATAPIQMQVQFYPQGESSNGIVQVGVCCEKGGS